ncbi:hypothetical protein I4U23_017393 [Adineta vaga]|nr:hypothetical protein I4U23_017393 [Adineta vaga]
MFPTTNENSTDIHDKLLDILNTLIQSTTDATTQLQHRRKRATQLFTMNKWEDVIKEIDDLKTLQAVDDGLLKMEWMAKIQVHMSSIRNLMKEELGTKVLDSIDLFNLYTNIDETGIEKMMNKKSTKKRKADQ